jgi:hypothetical protein
MECSIRDTVGFKVGELKGLAGMNFGKVLKSEKAFRH